MREQTILSEDCFKFLVKEREHNEAILMAMHERRDRHKKGDLGRGAEDKKDLHIDSSIESYACAKPQRSSEDILLRTAMESEILIIGTDPLDKIIVATEKQILTELGKRMKESPEHKYQKVIIATEFGDNRLLGATGKISLENYLSDTSIPKEVSEHLQGVFSALAGLNIETEVYLLENKTGAKRNKVPLWNNRNGTIPVLERTVAMALQADSL
ncbi:MAG: hypothetical protein Q7K43_02280, partial [Candidatus Woesearchaeota archaeon]|nr:hypothetical protein [Candidatus Woesearchaeota archaeon]